MAAAAAEAEPATEEGTLSIYKAARRIKRRGSTLYNALRSVAEDAAFVAEIAALWPALPLVANLRCGLWYTQPRTLAATCYFKSTDGHAGNWSFSTARLNLHLALLAGERGGCIIVDSTRKGKRFPDSMSKTIPIWCSVLNRAIQRHRLRASNQGDDEESWARGLTPALFWKHSYDLLDGGPDLCNQLVADIVEKDRVYRAQRGERSPQITVNHLKCSGDDGPYFYEEHTIITKPMNSDPSIITPIDTPCSNNSHLVVFWIGRSNLAVSSTIQVAVDLADVDCILNCDSTSRLPSSSSENSYLEIAIVGSKNDRFSLLKNLPKAINFAQRNLIARRKILLCCQTGEDISICVALAIITRLFNDSGCFDDGDSFVKRNITKLEMRKRLVFICKYAINARPSRGNLRQVYGFLCNEKAQLCC
ncbi:hypothetical protein BRADI_2g58742v3 [Brachypodium distachyon]|uniref:Rit1 DUSP-like domain-containing protein n=1 Tax=Brachypodium distachyon TaxID=15368 RepID=A0A0Q3RDD5_BRADI|nr:hypothetical protein BRADI_2g58742v3 [Brachypodium distachyon]